VVNAVETAPRSSALIGKCIELIRRKAYFVAKHPIPLSVGSVAHSSVGEVQVRCVVRVEALQSHIVFVAELSTPCRKIVSVFQST